MSDVYLTLHSQTVNPNYELKENKSSKVWSCVQITIPYMNFGIVDLPHIYRTNALICLFSINWCISNVSLLLSIFSLSLFLSLNLSFWLNYCIIYRIYSKSYFKLWVYVTCKTIPQISYKILMVLKNELSMDYSNSK